MSQWICFQVFKSLHSECHSSVWKNNSTGVQIPLLKWYCLFFFVWYWNTKEDYVGSKIVREWKKRSITILGALYKVVVIYNNIYVCIKLFKRLFRFFLHFSLRQVKKINDSTFCMVQCNCSMNINQQRYIPINIGILNRLVYLSANNVYNYIFVFGQTYNIKFMCLF